ncbi:MAG: SDR family oxidoreductase [Pararhodobacter sp.]
MRKAIVLGGYGLIGAACMRELAGAGFEVTGVGRSQRAALASNPSASWRIHDIARIGVAEWRALLSDAQVVVNAAGALQDGGRDDLEAIHVSAVEKLVKAAAGLALRIIHISAAGVSDTASTTFFRTKARGDAIIASRAEDWVILRPALVLAPDAYGGTALLRAVAALPLIQPQVLPETRVQTVCIADVAAAVLAAARGEVPSHTIADLAEPDARSFGALVAAIRRWQGYGVARFRPAIPETLLMLAARVADGLGHLGWRSPLRTTAIIALRDGIRGEPSAWQAAGGQRCRALQETLALLPATRQERLFARAYFALPLAIAVLALFWLLSGLITLLDPARAMALLSGRGAPAWLAGLAVFGGVAADIGLGVAILWRAWVRPAALGMLGLSALYLTTSLFAAPDLWADPLGPMVKVFPGMALAGLVWLMMEDR